jgi:hypothetical protein
MDREKPTELILRQEHKIHKLLSDANKKDDLEASGVFAKDNQFFVIFDNTARVAQISNWVSTDQTTASWAIPTVRFGADPVKGFEDITFDPKVGRFLLLVEAGLGKDNVLVVCQEVCKSSGGLVSVAGTVIFLKWRLRITA